MEKYHGDANIPVGQQKCNRCSTPILNYIEFLFTFLNALRHLDPTDQVIYTCASDLYVVTNYVNLLAFSNPSQGKKTTFLHASESLYFIKSISSVY